MEGVQNEGEKKGKGRRGRKRANIRGVEGEQKEGEKKGLGGRGRKKTNKGWRWKECRKKGRRQGRRGRKRRSRGWRWKEWRKKEKRRKEGEGRGKVEGGGGRNG